MNRWQANALLLFAGAIWGMGFVAQATAMDSIGPFTFVGLRFVVASLVVLPFAMRESLSSRAQNHRPVNSRDWVKFAIIGLSLFAGMATQQLGLLTTSVTNSGFLTGLYVVFTPILVVLLFRERQHGVVWIAAMLALSGIYLLSGGNLAQLVIGDLLTIGSAFFWALQVTLIARYVGQTGRPLLLSLVQFMVTAVLALIVAMATESLDWASLIEAAPQILYAGVFASGLAFTLQVIGQRYTSASQAAIFLSSEAPFAALFAFLVLGERIGLIGLCGCALIFLSMLAVELIPRWRAS